MEITVAFSLIFLFIYILTIVFFFAGYTAIKRFDRSEEKSEETVFVSIIIPFKNEEEHMASLFAGLKQQTYERNNFEVLFVNDHSSDGSEVLLSEYLKGTENFRLISQDEDKKGKKEALKKGIAHAKGKLIVTTDADCRHQPDWLKTISSFYLQYKPKMIIAPVVMTGKGFFAGMQSLEFFSLIASGAGATGIKRPIFCNGANLAYEKEAYEEFEDAMHAKEVSGDDVFLLHTLKRKYRNCILFLKSKDAIVYTDSESTFRAFIKQRIRWASKSKSYTDRDIIIVSLTVFLINLSIVALIPAVIFDVTILNTAIIIFVVKLLIDFLFLWYASIFFKLSRLLVLVPVLSVIYPFYIVLTAIFSIIRGFRQ